jgi:hypothetical protein
MALQLAFQLIIFVITTVSKILPFQPLMLRALLIQSTNAASTDAASTPQVPSPRKLLR